MEQRFHLRNSSENQMIFQLKTSESSFRWVLLFEETLQKKDEMATNRLLSMTLNKPVLGRG
jgi:hypothetical protein